MRTAGLCVALLLIAGCSSSASTVTSATASPVSDPAELLSPAARPSEAPSPSPISSQVPTPLAQPSPSPAHNAGLPDSLRGVEWTRLPTTRKIVALTFDAGANADGVPSILATLQKKGVPGTFFLTGRWIDVYPARTRDIALHQEHSIANHSTTHPHMRDLSAAQVTQEVTTAGQTILRSTGRDARPLFRFPYGESTAAHAATVNQLGYGSIKWTVDTQGWKGVTGGQTVDLCVKRAVDNAQPGEIILMHVGSSPDGTTLDADSLPKIIDQLRAQGYDFVAIWDFIYL